jgi:perosamine synthetase
LQIVEYKNEYAQKLDSKFKNRLILPKGMISGYYKYIVFEEIEKSTGKVYDNPCHRIMKHDVDLPNTDWVAKNHWCVPIYYNK